MVVFRLEAHGHQLDARLDVVQGRRERRVGVAGGGNELGPELARGLDDPLSALYVGPTDASQRRNRHLLGLDAQGVCEDEQDLRRQLLEGEEAPLADGAQVAATIHAGADARGVRTVESGVESRDAGDVGQAAQLVVGEPDARVHVDRVRQRQVIELDGMVGVVHFDLLSVQIVLTGDCQGEI